MTLFIDRRLLPAPLPLPSSLVLLGTLLDVPLNAPAPTPVLLLDMLGIPSEVDYLAILLGICIVGIDKHNYRGVGLLKAMLT